MKLAVTLLLSLVILFSEAQFAETPQLLVASQGVRDMYVSDLNNDGKGDILQTNYNNNANFATSIYFAEEQELIYDHQTRTSSGRVKGFGDFNNDGYDDLFLISEIVFNDGNGNFGPSNFVPYAPSTFRVYPFDMDGDGDMDIIGDREYWFRNDDSEYNEVLYYDDAGDQGEIVCADWDGDGDMDFINRYPNSPDFFSLNLNDGNEVFTRVPVGINIEGVTTGSYTLHDINVDGLPEFLYLGNSSLNILWNDGGSFTHQNIYSGESPPNFTRRQIQLIDADGDGDKDVLVGELYNEGLLLFNTDGGTLESTPQHVDFPTLQNGFSEKDFTVGDLDGDGDEDIIYSFDSNGRITWTRTNDGSGNFSELIPLFKNMGRSDFFGFTQIVQGGIPKIYWTSASFDNGLIALNHFAPDQNLPHFVFLEEEDGGLGVRSNISAGDLNEDGREDIVLAYNDHIYVLVDDGSGEFVEELTIPIEFAGWVVLHSVDINNDGFLDIIPIGSDETVYYLNNGNGTSFTATSFPGGQEHSNRYLADLNNDDFPDIIRNDDILINQGDGTFGSISHSLPEGEYFVGELNGDDSNDLVVNHSFSSELFINNGMEEFTSTALPFGDFGYGDILVYDWNSDGLNDLISRPQGIGYFMFAENLGDGNFVIDSSQDLEIPNELDVDHYQLLDVSNDSDLDLLFVLHESIYILEGLAENSYEISGTFYFDENGNGLFDEGEVTIPGQSIALEPGFSGNVTDDSGQFSFHPTFSDSYTLSAGSPPPNWTYSAETEFEVEITSEQPYSLNNDFAMVPMSDDPYLDINLIVNPMGCSSSNATTFISLRNFSSGSISGELVITFENVDDVWDIMPTADEELPNQLTFYISDLETFATQNFMLGFLSPDVEEIGDTYSFTAQFYDSENQLLFEEVEDNLVTCAYDPNDKLNDPKGFGDEGYILANNPMEYTVRFQNTGNAPATDVRIEDTIDEDLAINSIQILANSHDVDVSWVDDNLIFSFDNIMLPDSSTDLAGSQGFVKFRLNQKPDLMPGTVIENTAEIYFDLNPPIITNTVVNTIYTCDWLYDEPEVTVSGTTLIVQSQDALGYQWYGDGILIKGATNQSFDISLQAADNYFAEVEFEGNCFVQSELAFNTSVPNHADNQLQLFPNPAEGSVVLRLSNGALIEGELYIFDQSGRELMRKSQINASQLTLDISGLASGVYQIALINSSMNMATKLLKQ